jgi:tRNA(Phe) wybutosine-synthesizing methylase Tyw3
MKWAVRNDRLSLSKLKHMKQQRELDFTIPFIALVIFIVVMASSCSRSITVQQAADGKAKCGKWLR